MVEQALGLFFSGTRNTAKTRLPYVVRVVNSKTLRISLNILFARQMSAIFRQVSGADWAVVPMHERRPFAGKGNLSAK